MSKRRNRNKKVKEPTSRYSFNRVYGPIFWPESEVQERISLDLVEILALRRPSMGLGQQILGMSILDFANAFDPKNIRAVRDKVGNVTVFVGESRETMFTCHLDTVHSEEGKNEILESGDYLFTDDILGADDGAGVYIMCWMIANGRPGIYCFFVDEEVGRIGSDFWREENGSYISGIKRCISFDRRGKTDVITHQLGMRCMSDDAADWLCSQLGGGFEKCENGIFTDSFSFIDDIPECTNVSVGYENAHSSKEYLCYGFVTEMIEMLKGIDFSCMPTVRDPNQKPAKQTLPYSLGNQSSTSRYNHGYSHPGYNDSLEPDYYSNYHKRVARTPSEIQVGFYDDIESSVSADEYARSNIIKYIRRNPETTLELLSRFFSIEEIECEFLSAEFSQT